jgi:hypothetical protein
MFDANHFKRSVKEWIKRHPEGTEAELVDFCEEQIPPAQFSAHQWLVEHTLSWYRHILAQRQHADSGMDEADEATIN